MIPIISPALWQSTKKKAKKVLRLACFPTETEFEISIGERCFKCQNYIGLDGELGAQRLCNNCLTAPFKARKYHSETIDNILKDIPLETSLFVGLTMDDIDNWHDGEYKGNREKIKEQVSWIMDEVREWVKNGMPEKPPVKENDINNFIKDPGI